MGLTSYVGKNVLENQVVNYQQGTLVFCFFIAFALFLLLPKKIPMYKRIASSALIFIGIYGLFSMLLKSLIGIIG